MGQYALSGFSYWHVSRILVTAVYAKEVKIVKHCFFEEIVISLYNLSDLFNSLIFNLTSFTDSRLHTGYHEGFRDVSPQIHFLP